MVILLSGGLDSTTLLYDLHGQGHSMHAVLFDYKQQHVQELLFAKAHCHRLGILFTVKELPALHGLTDENWVVPNRNMVMLSVAVNVAVQAGAQTIVIGCNKGDAAGFPDCRKEFIKAMNAAVLAAGYNIEICAPYLSMMKWEIAGIARDCGVPMCEIWTCYRGGAKPCGNCPACEKLAAALEPWGDLEKQ